jgi:hypothetical protein
MNKKQQQKHVGQTRRLRPIPRNAAGQDVDDPWLVASAGPSGLDLTNGRTGHNLTLGYDHILEYRTPDFLLLKSHVLLTPTAVEIEPIVTPPRVVLDVKLPLPAPVKDQRGLWVQTIDVRPSQDAPVPRATVEVVFDSPYELAEYEVVRQDPAQALLLQELFGAEGRHAAAHFRMGLAELPRGTWIRLRFFGRIAPLPREIKLHPYLKA